jgi:hypothetical protein
MIAEAHGHGTTPSAIQRAPSERLGKADGRGWNLTQYGGMLELIAFGRLPMGWLRMKSARRSRLSYFGMLSNPEEPFHDCYLTYSSCGAFQKRDPMEH